MSVRNVTGFLSTLISVPTLNYLDFLTTLTIRNVFTMVAFMSTSTPEGAHSHAHVIYLGRGSADGVHLQSGIN
jgi:hypothetical protein